MFVNSFRLFIAEFYHFPAFTLGLGEEFPLVGLALNELTKCWVKALIAATVPL
jgi:hypothetical protein